MGQQDIPSVAELVSIMEKYSNDLYTEWRRELGVRLRELEFEGYISKDQINVNDVVYRLPNEHLRKAVCNLESDFESLGYDYDFRFEDVGLNFVLFYRVILPERDDVHEEGEEEGEEL